MSVAVESPIEALDADRIRAGLPDSICLGGLAVHRAVDSTNSWLQERSRALPSPYACLSEHQIAGRGRRGRNWTDGEGRDICLSLLWRFDAAESRAQGLSLAIGVATVRALEAIGARGIRLKWPNDIVWRDRKLGGILIEGSVSGRVWTVVIGVGVNVHPEPSRDAPTDRAHVESISNARVSRNSLAARLITEISTECARFAARGPGPAIGEWKQLDVLQGRPVRVHRPSGETRGIARGVDEAGELLVEVNGTLERFVSAEVSVRSGSAIAGEDAA